MRLRRDIGVAGNWWRVGRFFVNLEPFCGNTKPVERPESRVEEMKDKRRRHGGAFKVGMEVS